ncbi:MAG: NAD-dependent epimerase/dehydratase family protein [Planctomycetaceae bacterium]|nr:MAG: NAD-dependent epimerase/dehydratase family protein [Planctomycetaceae bacterium]
MGRRVFLTGVTGFLGNNLARALTERGNQVVALVRGKPDPRVWEGLDVEQICGDLGDAEVIDRAVASCEAVIHSAALIHVGWTRLEESLRVNRDGTAVVAAAALRHGRRMVHVATVNTLPRHVGRATAPAVHEETPLTPANDQVPCAYVVSKRASVAEVERRLDRGLDAVLVHPGFMLGPWDWKPSSGRMILELGKRYVPGCPTGGCSVCDVRDVSEAIVSALDHGGRGRHYILAGENWSYRRLWTELARRQRRLRPIFPVGPLIRVGVAAYGRFQARRVGQETELNSAALKLTSHRMWYDSRRAEQELGYTRRELAQTLDEATHWVRSHF